MSIKHLVVALGISGALATSPVMGSSEDLQSLVELFRSDLSAAKKETIIAAMQLSADEAAVFWPIYRAYEVELANLGDQRLAVITQFVTAQRAGQLDDARAREISEKSFHYYQQRFELWKKYHARIAEALSAVRAAQFLQVEHQVSLLIDLGIASEMPLVGSPPSAPTTP